MVVLIQHMDSLSNMKMTLFQPTIQPLLLVLVLTLALALPIALHAKSETIVRLTNGEWRPLFSEEYKEFGLFSHIVKRAFEQSNIKVSYGFFPWARGLKLAEKSAEWDGAVGWSKTPEREVLFHYSNPVMKVAWVFFHRKDNNFVWTDFDSLAHYSLAATQGYFYSDDFKSYEEKKKIKVIRVADDLMGLRLLLNNRIDAFPLTAEVGYDLLNTKYPKAKEMITNHQRPISTQPLFLIISKQAANGEKLIKIFNENLQKMRDAGDIIKMREASFEGKYHPNAN